MVRTTAFILTVIIAFAGCSKRKAPEPEISAAEQRKNIEEGLRKKIPVLDRMLVEEDLRQIHLFLDSSRSGSKWPKDMNVARSQLQSDPNMRKLLEKLDDGTYMIVGNPSEGGMLAYCTKESTVGFIAVTTSKDFTMYKTMDELKAAADKR